MASKEQRIKQLQDRLTRTKDAGQRSLIQKQLEVIERTAPGSVSMVSTPEIDPQAPPSAQFDFGGTGRRALAGRTEAPGAALSSMLATEDLPDPGPVDFAQRFMAALTAPLRFTGLNVPPPQTKDTVGLRLTDIAGILPSFIATEIALAKALPALRGEQMMARILRLAATFGLVEAGAAHEGENRAAAFAKGALTGVPFAVLLSPKLPRPARFLGGAGIGATVGGPAPVSGSKEEQILLMALLGALGKTRVEPGPRITDTTKPSEIKTPEQLSLFPAKELAPPGTQFPLPGIEEAKATHNFSKLPPGTDVGIQMLLPLPAGRQLEFLPEKFGTIFTMKGEPFDPRFEFDVAGEVIKKKGVPPPKPPPPPDPVQGTLFDPASAELRQQLLPRPFSRDQLSPQHSGPVRVTLGQDNGLMGDVATSVDLSSGMQKFGFKIPFQATRGSIDTLAINADFGRQVPAKFREQFYDRVDNALSGAGRIILAGDANRMRPTLTGFLSRGYEVFEAQGAGPNTRLSLRRPSNQKALIIENPGELSLFHQTDNMEALQREGFRTGAQRRGTARVGDELVGAYLKSDSNLVQPQIIGGQILSVTASPKKMLVVRDRAQLVAILEKTDPTFRDPATRNMDGPRTTQFLKQQGFDAVRILRDPVPTFANEAITTTIVLDTGILRVGREVRPTDIVARSPVNLREQPETPGFLAADNSRSAVGAGLADIEVMMSSAREDLKELRQNQAMGSEALRIAVGRGIPADMNSRMIPSAIGPVSLNQLRQLQLRALNDLAILEGIRKHKVQDMAASPVLGDVPVLKTAAVVVSEVQRKLRKPDVRKKRLALKGPGIGRVGPGEGRAPRVDIDQAIDALVAPGPNKEFLKVQIRQLTRRMESENGITTSFVGRVPPGAAPGAAPIPTRLSFFDRATGIELGSLAPGELGEFARFRDFLVNKRALIVEFARVTGKDRTVASAIDLGEHLDLQVQNAMVRFTDSPLIVGLPGGPKYRQFVKVVEAGTERGIAVELLNDGTRDPRTFIMRSMDTGRAISSELSIAEVEQQLLRHPVDPARQRPVGLGEAVDNFVQSGDTSRIQGATQTGSDPIVRAALDQRESKIVSLSARARVKQIQNIFRNIDRTDPRAIARATDILRTASQGRMEFIGIGNGKFQLRYTDGRRVTFLNIDDVAPALVKELSRQKVEAVRAEASVEEFRLEFESLLEMNLREVLVSPEAIAEPKSVKVEQRRLFKQEQKKKASPVEPEDPSAETPRIFRPGNKRGDVVDIPEIVTGGPAEKGAIVRVNEAGIATDVIAADGSGRILVKNGEGVPNLTNPALRATGKPEVEPKQLLLDIGGLEQVQMKLPMVEAEAAAQGRQVTILPKGFSMQDVEGRQKFFANLEEVAEELSRDPTAAPDITPTVTGGHGGPPIAGPGGMHPRGPTEGDIPPMSSKDATLGILPISRVWRPLKKWAEDVELKTNGLIPAFRIWKLVSRGQLEWLKAELPWIERGKAIVSESGVKRGRAAYYYLGAKDAAERNHAIATFGITPAEIKSFNKLRVAFDELFIDLGVARFAPYEQNYVPFRGKTMKEVDMAIPRHARPREFDFWADHFRRGDISFKEDNLFKLYFQYVRAGTKSRFFQPFYTKASEMIDGMTRAGTHQIPGVSSVHSRLLLFMDEARNVPDQLRRDLVTATDNVMRDLGVDADKARLGNVVDFMLTLNYGANMAFRYSLVLRNLTQTMLTIPYVGPKYWARALHEATTPEGKAEAAKAGVLFQPAMPYEAETLTRFGKIGTFARRGTAPFRRADEYNRVVSFLAGKRRVQFYGAQLEKGEIDLAQFARKSKINLYHPLERAEILAAAKRGNIEKASELAGLNLHQNTQWIYIRGNEPQMFSGTVGRLFGQYGTWPVWYLEYLRGIVRYGSAVERFGAVAALFAAFAAFDRSASALFDADISPWIFFGPLNYGGGPYLDFARNMLDFLFGSESDKGVAASRLKTFPTQLIPGSGLVRELKKAAEQPDLTSAVNTMLGYPPIESTPELVPSGPAQPPPPSGGLETLDFGALGRQKTRELPARRNP